MKISKNNIFIIAILSAITAVIIFACSTDPIDNKAANMPSAPENRLGSDQANPQDNPAAGNADAEPQFAIVAEEELAPGDPSVEILRANVGLPDQSPLGTADWDQVRRIQFRAEGDDFISECFIIRMANDKEVPRFCIVSEYQGTYKAAVVEVIYDSENSADAAMSASQSVRINIYRPAGELMAGFEIGQDGRASLTYSPDSDGDMPLGWWDDFLRCVARRWDATPWWIGPACDVICSSGGYACYICVMAQGYWGWLVISYCLMWA